jgi:hypothetical protein
MPDLVDRIAADLAAVRWPDAAEIRGRAVRRRRRRIAVAGGLATVVAIAVALPVAVTARSGGDDSGPPAAAAERLVEIPPEALLQPEDVGPGLVALRETVAENESVSDVRLLDLLAATCPAYGSLDLYDGSYRYQRSYTVQTPPTDAGDPTTGDPVLRQFVLRLDDGLAARVVDDLLLTAGRCADYTSAGPAETDEGRVDVVATHRWRVAFEGFAGDQSFVLTHAVEVRRAADGRPFAAPTSRPAAVVRVGDLVSVISWTDGGIELSEVRRLVARAATWLCVASNPPC